MWQKNHKHVFADGVPVVISKAECEHTGSCNPSTQQQIVQRSRSGDYFKKISDQSLFTLVTMYERTGSLPSPLVREILAAQFPRNKNVTYNHVYYMKKRGSEYSTFLEGYRQLQRLFCYVEIFSVRSRSRR